MRPRARGRVVSRFAVGADVARVTRSRRLVEPCNPLEEFQLAEDSLIVAGELLGDLLPLDRGAVADRGGDRVENLGVRSV